jgi:GT2 family glycosyltransferase
MKFSVIIPVYNRPEELNELLVSLSEQSYQNFEVIVVEDGSMIKSFHVIEKFDSNLSIRYISQENTGQGFARNHGMRIALGDFFIILDSDVILPLNYLKVLSLEIPRRHLDAFGGPDASNDDFSPLQKAMDFAMTSLWTTGGIRGKLKNPAKYQARGFNMGVSREVFEATAGFVDPNRGEDIEWSIRVKKAGFKLELVEEAFVYHKRKNTLFSFAKQAFSFGQNRVNVSRFHPEAIKLVHAMPSMFLGFLLLMPFFFLAGSVIFQFQVIILVFWMAMVLLSAFTKFKKPILAFLSLMTSFIQLISYGAGLLLELGKKQIKG